MTQATEFNFKLKLRWAPPWPGLRAYRPLWHWQAVQLPSPKPACESGRFSLHLWPTPSALMGRIYNTVALCQSRKVTSFVEHAL